MSLNQSRLMGLIVKPRLTEKSFRNEAESWYTFEVRPEANKYDIAAAVELLFKVDVTRVNVTRVSGKQKTFGQRRGRRSALTKASVKVVSGQQIDFSGF